MSGRAFAWPDGKRIAVTVNAMLETWSEGKAPPYGVQASQHKPGIDHSGIAWGSYGGKVGVWRLMALLNRHGIRGTFCVNARCAEIFPEAVTAIVQQGHDVAGHGYLQDQLLTANGADEEQAAIRRSLDMLEQATGQRPTGWISPVTAFTEHTRKFLAAEKLLWHGDARDTDLPSVVETEARSDRADSGLRLHRQPHAALEPAGRLGRLQGDLRLSARLRVAGLPRACRCIATSADGR